MPAWIARPGRALGLLEALGVWTVVLAVLTERVVAANGSARFIAAIFFIGAMVGVVCWEHERPRELLAFVRAERWQVWLPALPVVVWMALEGPVERWQLPIVVTGAAATWISGALRLTADGARLETERAVFLLAKAPVGVEDGELLTLPRLDLVSSAAGPYRTGRAIGRAPELWRASAPDIARRLTLRGLVLLAWSAALTFWLI